MILLLAAGLVWTLVHVFLPRTKLTLISVRMQTQQGRDVSHDAPDDILAGVALFTVKYAARGRKYVAISSANPWPVRVRSRKVEIASAELCVNDDRIDVTNRVRKVAGVNNDFHVHGNDLTWKSLLDLQGGTLLVRLKRRSLFFARTTTHAVTMDTPLSNLKTYVI